MNKNFFFLLLLVSTHAIRIAGKVHILLTAALTEAHYEFRKKEYIAAFDNLINFGYQNFYIVEALKKSGPTFLNDYCKNVFYATSNDPDCINQGANESRTMLEALYHFNFDPDDIIIKITGRHRLISDHFLKLVQNNPEYDVFIKICQDLMPAWQDGMIPSMCFAMRCKYLIEMYEEIDYIRMLEDNIPIEWEIPYYLFRKSQTESLKIYEVGKLDIRMNAFASSASPGQNEKIYIF